jgi:hypothetical protein
MNRTGYFSYISRNYFHAITKSFSFWVKCFTPPPPPYVKALLQSGATILFTKQKSRICVHILFFICIIFYFYIFYYADISMRDIRTVIQNIIETLTNP